MLRRASNIVAVAGVVALLAMGSRAVAVAATPTDLGPWLSAIANEFVLIDVSTGDLDGDGKDETVACYTKERGGQPYGGIVVLKGRGPSLTPVFHGQLRVRCEKVRIAKRKLGILLEGAQQLVWKHGEDIKLRADRGSFQSKIVARASSSKPGRAPAKVLDGQLSTSWAESAPGTGINQTLTLRLPEVTDVGTVGIVCGDASGPRQFFESNRIHRGSIEAKTDADLGDAAAGVDFAALGIEPIGDRIEFSCENRPQVTYVNVGKRDVVEIQVRIDSVYLGDKHDDTHVSEIEVVPILPDALTLDRARPVKGAASAKEPTLPPNVKASDPGASPDASSDDDDF